MDFHPIANLFPLMEGAEFDALVADVQAHGLREAILVDKKTQTIIDGRNRYRACWVEPFTEPRFESWEGDDPIAFVLSMNLHRRHLNESQRAMVAARIANIPKHLHRDRSIDLSVTQPEGDAQICASLSQSEADRQICLSVTQPEAAKELKVAPRSVRSAKKVLDSGDTQLIAAVECGEVPVAAAVQLTGFKADTRTEVLDKLKAGEYKNAAEAIRTVRHKARLSTFAEPAPLDSVGQKYAVIYADPPWRYEHAMDSGDCIEEHYPTLALNEICALPLADIAADNCVLFLWATNPKLSEAMRVIEAWGFNYRTNSCWVKHYIGPGYYFRQRHELLLVATRGEPPTPLPENRPDSVQESPRQAHSQKPKLYYELIEHMYPGASKVELFARNRREGWESWGNEVEREGA